jgi:hypothetical protein
MECSWSPRRKKGGDGRQGGVLEVKSKSAKSKKKTKIK